MKTKYELFLEHLIHGIDEPQRTFKSHHKIGFVKDKFALKGKLLSATKIFLSDDFVKKQFWKWNDDARKKEIAGNPQKDIRTYHEDCFKNSLPLYDNMLILFPYLLSNVTRDNVEGDFMSGCWIQKQNDNKILAGKITNNKSTYRITTFDNACKFHGYKERLNLSLLDYFVDFDGGIISNKEDNYEKIKDILFNKIQFGREFIEPVKESYKSFIDFLPSSLLSKKCDVKEFVDLFNSEEYEFTYQSQMGIFVHLNLLHFINAKGSETIAFKSHLPIKKRSNVLKGFEYKMLEVKKANTITTRYGDSINKNRLHDVRGHMRHYQSGKRTWIKSHQRGDEKMGVIIKDYNFK